MVVSTPVGVGRIGCSLVIFANSVVIVIVVVVVVVVVVVEKYCVENRVSLPNRTGVTPDDSKKF